VLENSLIQQEGGWQGSGGSATALSPSFLLAQAIFEPNLFPYKYSNIFKPSHPLYLSAYEDGTECSETSAHKMQTPENYPEEAYNNTLLGNLYHARFFISTIHTFTA